MAGMHILADIFNYPLSNINSLFVIKDYLFLRIYRHLFRFTGIKIILLIDNDSLAYTSIKF